MNELTLNLVGLIVALANLVLQILIQIANFYQDIYFDRGFGAYFVLWLFSISAVYLLTSKTYRFLGDLFFNIRIQLLGYELVSEEIIE